MANKNDNKSMFLYTALIFFVAVILIILSFFGQTNLQKSQPQMPETSETSKPSSGIAEKASVLSEENTTLLNENNTLKQENFTLSDENTQLKAANDKLTKAKNTNDLLLSANGYYFVGNTEMALEVLKKINYDELSTDQKIIYDNLNNNLQ